MTIFIKLYFMEVGLLELEDTLRSSHLFLFLTIFGLVSIQGSHLSGLTKFHDISRFFKKIPGIFSEYFNVASNYFWINVYIKVSPEQNISFPQYPIVTPALTATPQAKHMSG